MPPCTLNVTDGGESFFGNLIKSLAPLGAPLTPIGPGVGGPAVPGAVGIPSNGIARGGCPLCDSSVYSYCSGKLIHDACCCSGGKTRFTAPQQLLLFSISLSLYSGAGLPFNCRGMDCTFLNANSCQEYALIFTCCCNNPYHK